MASEPTCGACGDTGWRPASPAADGVTRVARCECQAARRSVELLEAAAIPPRYQHCTLENFATDGNRELEAALITARGYAQNFPGGVDRDRSGLLFVGDVGLGKTHLVVAIAQKLLERGTECRFCDHRDLLKRIQATFDPANPATESGVVRPLMDANVLILDDLGVGRATDWALETLHYLLNHRYSHQLATLVTTNLEDNDARPLGEGGKFKDRAPLAHAIGERLRSRLYEMCVAVPMHGHDFRRSRTPAAILNELAGSPPRS